MTLHETTTHIVCGVIDNAWVTDRTADHARHVERIGAVDCESDLHV
jgi:hypothetical protein